MISEITRISMVTTAEATATYWLPNTTWVWAPTPAAPTVCAMVLRLSSADSGRSTSSFRRLRRAPAWPPLFSIRLI